MHLTGLALSHCLETWTISSSVISLVFWVHSKELVSVGPTREWCLDPADHHFSIYLWWFSISFAFMLSQAVHCYGLTRDSWILFQLELRETQQLDKVLFKLWQCVYPTIFSRNLTEGANKAARSLNENGGDEILWAVCLPVVKYNRTDELFNVCCTDSSKTHISSLVDCADLLMVFVLKTLACYTWW